MELLLIISTFFIAASIGLLTKRQRVIELAAIVAAIISLIGSIIIAYKVAAIKIYNVSAVFSIDALGAIILLIVSIIGVATAFYSIEYLRQETTKEIIRVNRPRQYFVLLNLFMMAMFLATSFNNPVLAWISIEATTLSTAFLISFYNKPSAMEAAWKYLIVNSVGLLIGFFGTMLYFTAFQHGAEAGLVTWQSLLENASNMNPIIAKIAFIFILIGYGTKVGFVPMHTWKPDAYGKAPAPIGAMFSGALLPVAFLMILKFRLITNAVVGISFSQHLFLAFGLMSVAIPAFMMLILKDYKRMLAYSSIENAGVIALGFGFGGLAILASILHIIYHSFVKASLFFLSGNFLLKYNSAKIENVKGSINIIPITSVLFLTGFVAIIGAPPFGILFTKILIFSAGIGAYPVISLVSLMLIVILFIGFFKHVVAMVFGEKSTEMKREKENIWLILPSLSLMVIVLLLSFYQPAFLQTLINNAALQY